jgi:WD40 repeat protein
VLISQKPRHLLWADKFGEVRHVSLEPLPQYGDAELRKASGLEGSFLLGHISLITDMALSPASDLILTADRDEKVRVSRFPFAAEIEAYCLGHTEYASAVASCCNSLKTGTLAGYSCSPISCCSLARPMGRCACGTIAQASPSSLTSER